MAKLTRTEIRSIALEIEKKVKKELTQLQEEEMKRPEVVNLIKETREHDMAIQKLNEIKNLLLEKEKLELKIDEAAKQYQDTFNSKAFQYNSKNIFNCDNMMEKIVETKLEESGLLKYRWIGQPDFYSSIEQKIQFEVLQCVIPVCDMYDVVLKQARKALGLE